MTAKTAGQAAYEKRAEKRADCPYAPWEKLMRDVQDEWQEIAAAARTWEPPKEPTLGEVAEQAYYDLPNPASRAARMQAAGEACAAVGAEREREAMRDRIRQHGFFDLIPWLDARTCPRKGESC